MQERAVGVLDDALDELPANQRDLHRARVDGAGLQGTSQGYRAQREYDAIAERYAVLHLRKRLLAVDENFGKS